ncbi:MAG: methyltransferase [Paracoccaceae bacterium]
MDEPTPERIMSVASGYGVSKALLTATSLGLFGRLAKGAMSLEDIIAEYGLRQRPAMDVLDLLVSVGLLDRKGDGQGALYQNTPETAEFLDPAKPRYVGGIIELWENRNFGFWAGLTNACQTGEPQSESGKTGEGFFESLYADPARLEAFMDAMTGSSRFLFERLSTRFPFDRYKTVADVGGADGLLSRLLAASHNHLSLVTLDLPAVTAIAQKRIEEEGLSDRISAVSGDFFTDPLPKADIITMGMILHDWDLEKKKLLVRKAYEALEPSGALMVIESLIDDARRENTFGLFLSLNMLIEFGDRAFDYTASEFIEWGREAGFRRFEVIPLTSQSSAAVAYK